MDRRTFVKRAAIAGAGAALGMTAGCASPGRSEAQKAAKTPSPTRITDAVSSSAEDELILSGARAALEMSLRPTLLERIYPGHFMVSADGGYGAENTWPGLDGWQMAGAYLLVGHLRAMLDYFDFVQASQRADGNIPFAIFPGEPPPAGMDSFLRGLRFPQDVYTYQPRQRPGQPAYSSLAARKWIGLFTHWQVKVNPLSVLGAVSFILTASEIFAATADVEWLREKLPSLDGAGQYLWSRISPNGLLAGAGFYLESPPRNQWDGITQCYGVHALGELAGFHRASGRSERAPARSWEQRAELLRSRFQQVFWQRDHYAEYVHPEHGVVDLHGLSDVNWAAIGLGVANEKQCRAVWGRLMDEPAFWRGEMPTHLVTRPNTYEKWELAEPLPFPYADFTHDVAAMGRVWHLETLACLRMGAHQRLRESVIKVCQMGKKHDWAWFERYHAAENNTVTPAGHRLYCEYPAILVQVVLKNPRLFPQAAAIKKLAA